MVSEVVRSEQADDLHHFYTAAKLDSFVKNPIMGSEVRPTFVSGFLFKHITRRAAPYHHDRFHVGGEDKTMAKIMTLLLMINGGEWGSILQLGVADMLQEGNVSSATGLNWIRLSLSLL